MGRVMIVRGYVAFAVVLALLVVAGLRYDREFRDPTAGGTLPSPESIGPDWYVAADDQLLTWDHYVYYAGYGTAVANARASDVVIVGNSRSQYALIADDVLDVGRQRGWRIHHMGVGHGESMRFTEMIFERHDIRPAVVIVGVDTSVVASSFSAKLSPFAQAMIDKGSWAAIREVYGHYWLDAVRLPMEHLLPSAHPNDLRKIIYRSWSTGFWRRQGSSLDSPGQFPIESYVDSRTAEVRAHQTAEARAFVQRMRARGSAVVFAWIPTPDTTRESAVDLAAAADVPLIAPDLEGLRTFDGSHLDLDSAQRYTAAFLDQLGPIVEPLMAARSQ